MKPRQHRAGAAFQSAQVESIACTYVVHQPPIPPNAHTSSPLNSSSSPPSPLLRLYTFLPRPLFLLRQPSWYGKFNSPYYTDTHVAYRAKVRAFVEAEIMPFTHEWDESKSLPLELYKKTYEAGILPGVVGAPWAGGMGDQLAVKPPENFDYFHEAGARRIP